MSDEDYIAYRRWRSFAGDGRSPQGDIMKRHKAQGVRRKEVSVGFSIRLAPYALRLVP